MVKVRTLDGCVFEISEDAARLSGLLKTILQVDPHQLDGETDVNVGNSNTMTTILRYLDHYKTGNSFSRITRPLHGPDLRMSGVNEFDCSFIDSIPLETVKTVLVAADYLDILSLTELCCAKLASYIKAIPLTHMMAKLGISELTPEWGEAARKRHQWCKTIQTIPH